MRIGIDGYNLAMSRGTGVATYGMNLAITLQALGHQVEGVFGLDVGPVARMREIMFYDLIGREPRRRGRPLLKGMVNLTRPFFEQHALDVPLSDWIERQGFVDRLPDFQRLFSKADLFESAHAHFAMFGRFTNLRVSNPPDIMHWTYPVPVRLVGAKNIYTLHDLVPLRLPFTTLDRKQAYHTLIREVVNTADHICTVSDASRRDIISFFAPADDRITNTYQASLSATEADATKPDSDAEMIRGIFGLDQRGYFLFFGAIEPKKNVGRIIEAYLSIQSETPLVIVGSPAWQSEGELALLKGGGYGRMAKTIMRLDYLPRDLLLKLIRGARGVIFPSLYEGFGLPVLEAMQVGTPVLTSRTSSLPEVAGNGAILVDPYSVSAIAEAMRALDRDEELRSELGRKGLIRGSFFSKQNYASRLTDLYSATIGRTGRATAGPR